MEAGFNREAFYGIISRKVRASALEVMDIRGRFLDIGCGDGALFLEALKEGSGAEFFGIDLSRPSILKARERCEGAHLLQGDFFNMPFKESTFDRVSLLNTVMNLTDEALSSLLGEIKRILKRGGKAYIEFRNTDNPLIRWRYRKALKEGLFVRGFDPGSFKRLLEREGLRVRKTKAIGIPSRWLALSYITEVEKP